MHRDEVLQTELGDSYTMLTGRLDMIVHLIKEWAVSSCRIKAFASIDERDRRGER